MIRTWMMLGMLMAAPVLAQTAEEEAGDVSEVDKDAKGPLKERVRPVSGYFFKQDGRFELSPGIAFSLRDAFFNKYVLGGLLAYHFTEELGLALRAGYALSSISGSTQVCDSSGCRPPTRQKLEDSGAYGNIRVMGDLELQWAPIYGKISLSAEAFLPFKLYVFIGPGVVMYGPTGDLKLSFGGTAGIGFRFAATRFLAVRMEFRDFLYQENRLNKRSLRNQLMFDFGISFFFPTGFDS
ncbi:MAG: outer membrane beta-barrel domain-containing protein [Proteobacteria bacterium]|nr:outer membrane beta-barrel domain-containing protein [Cystobacterineae bacterium]MCL2258256.1 outer membrane beta-barrel domain-containing protein [Cystobacterineae bacterium]MCL2315417.1 outer membrane beta-barrel domain-containing protein [Pseudomonadota bacterium]